MSQYERIVSYIYQYDHDRKGANTGFARVERRGKYCRIFVQIRSFALDKMPQVYLYRQLPDGIETVCIGQLTVQGNNFICKAQSDAGQLFQSEFAMDDMDGLLIYMQKKLYFATSWRNDTFQIGNWQETDEAAAASPQAAAQSAVPESQAAASPQAAAQSAVPESQGAPGQKAAVQSAVPESQAASLPQAAIHSVMPENPTAQETARKNRNADLQMQSVCSVCPFKRNTYDYGKKILMSFPSMKPFREGVVKSCVRIELQDIGCLPIQFWSLSGNRFLLHSYYCYRHLLFAKKPDEKYVLGVPGIFSEKERRNAARFGFYDFQAIGEGGSSQGAFGYWMMEMPKAPVDCGEVGREP
ncbi:MAG: DUF6128 domain-containing protein [Clostridiaceae bacterium]|nr:DUF6128 domain-containing protein [Clostridiaceae bacterium]